MTTVITKCFERFTEASIDDEIVIMRIDTGEFFSLTGTAVAIWRAMDEASDRDRLVQRLSEEFSASDSEIGEDVDDFLRRLRELGLIAES